MDEYGPEVSPKGTKLTLKLKKKKLPNDSIHSQMVAYESLHFTQNC